jgi:hypothetical protein
MLFSSLPPCRPLDEHRRRSAAGHRWNPAAVSSRGAGTDRDLAFPATHAHAEPLAEVDRDAEIRQGVELLLDGIATLRGET